MNIKSVLISLVVLCLCPGGCEKEEAVESADNAPAAPKVEVKTTAEEEWPKKPLIAGPIVEKAIREELKKPEGELTKKDLEKVKLLHLRGNKLTELPKGLEKLTQLQYLHLENNQLTDVKGLENLTQLTELRLGNNPNLTKAQIDQLWKALPKWKNFDSDYPDLNKSQAADL